MDEKFTEMLKYLRLGGLLANWDEYLKVARKGQYSHARLLKYVLEAEYKLKIQNAKKRRLKKATIPEMLVI